MRYMARPENIESAFKAPFNPNGGIAVDDDYCGAKYPACKGGGVPRDNYCGNYTAPSGRLSETNP